MFVGLNLWWQGTLTKAVYTGGGTGIRMYGLVCGRVCTGGAVFKFVIEIDQSETTKSHMFNMSLKLTNHQSLMANYQCPKVKYH